MYRSASSIHPSVSLINLETVPIDVTCHLNTTLWGGKGEDGLEAKLSTIRDDGTVAQHHSQATVQLSITHSTVGTWEGC